MPTVLTSQGFRFFFYSNENDEPIHIYAEGSGGETKIWLEPELKVAYAYNLSAREQRIIMQLVLQNRDVFKKGGMNTFRNNYDLIEKLIFDMGLRIKGIDLISETDDMLIYLNNNDTIKFRFSHLKGFKNISKESFMNYRLIADGTGIHWPELDEDLSLKGFLKEFLKQKMKDEQELVIA